MSEQKQISATISSTAKDELDKFTETHGLKKNYVIEQALLLFMSARRERPDEAIVPARIVLENEEFDRIAAMMELPSVPNEALRKLMRGERS